MTHPETGTVDVALERVGDLQAAENQARAHAAHWFDSPPQCIDVEILKVGALVTAAPMVSGDPEAVIAPSVDARAWLRHEVEVDILDRTLRVCRKCRMTFTAKEAKK